MNKVLLSMIAVTGFSLVGCLGSGDASTQSVAAPAVAPAVAVQAPTPVVAPTPAPAPAVVPVVADSTIVTQSQKVNEQLAALKNEPPPVLPDSIAGHAGFRDANANANAANNGAQPTSASFKPASVSSASGSSVSGSSSAANQASAKKSTTGTGSAAAQ